MITPTPLTAAVAGALAALAWPTVWARFGDASGDGLGLVLATLLLIALPAHAFVVGFRRESVGAGVDRPLLQRIGAWLAAAAGTSLLAPGITF